MIDIRWNPSRRELRAFSLMLIAFGLIVAAIVWYRTNSANIPAIIAIVGVLVGGLGAVYPPAARPVYLAWMVAAFPIGWTVSHLVLAAAFYFVFTPIGWLLRLSGRDPMHRHFDRDAESYWEPRPEPRPPGDYFRQF
jgi:hypothetical protein